MLTVNEVAARLKVTPHTVYQWLKRGSLKGALKLPGGGWRIPEEAVERMLTPQEECDGVAS